MVGKVSIKVWNNRVQYKFEIRRNISILKGDSATGKTTLIDMIDLYLQQGDKSGISLVCDKKCYVLSGVFWKDNLRHMQDSVVFIDEGNEFLRSQEFAKAIKNTDNYYVIATREALPMLPYSVDEVYGIKNITRGYGKVKRLYSELQHIYHQEDIINSFVHVIVEDSNSGYTFFRNIFDKRGIDCQSAQGKSNIVKKIMEIPKDHHVLIIADGAAFGPEMEKVLKMRLVRRICLFLPESFEWLILKAGVIQFDGGILDRTEEYADSKKFFSWEQFFTEYLTDITKNTYLAYSKKELNPNYLKGKIADTIENVLPEKIRG